jgi:adenylylsulfate kinase
MHYRNANLEVVDSKMEISDDNDDENMNKDVNFRAMLEPLPPRVIVAESHTRSIVKGLTWRILATSTTTIIAYFVTGHVDTAIQIGFFEFFAKLAIYYLHERAWTRIRL